MKVKSGSILVIFLFVLLVFGTLFLIRPVYGRLLSQVNSSASTVYNLVEERTNLHISYESLSPSVLTSFSLKDVSLKDSDERTVIKIKRIRVNYNIIKLIFRGYEKGISSFVIDGVDVDAGWLISLFDKNELSENSVENEKKSDDFSGFDIDVLKTRFPFDVVLKNISIFYQIDKDKKIEIALKKISAAYEKDNKLLTVSLKSTLAFFAGEKRISCAIDAEGTVFDGLENSFLKINISDLTDGNIHFNRFSFLADFKDNILNTRTIQSTIPLEISGNLNLSDFDFEFSLLSDNLSPNMLFSTKRRSSRLPDFKGLSLDEEFHIRGNLSKVKIDYSDKTKLTVPETIVPAGVVFRTRFTGNEKQINLDQFDFYGPNYDVSSSLQLNLAKKTLSGLVSVPKIVLPNGTVISTEVYFDPLAKGFMAFAPQIFFDETALTAFQLSVMPEDESIDFSLDVSDYSHTETGEPGVITASGSYLMESKYLQSSLGVTSLNIESAAEIAGQLLPEKLKETVLSVKDNFKDYVLAADVYLSTDMKSLSYNVPYVLVASTKKNDQALMFALDGNDQQLTVSQVSLVLGKKALFGSLSAEKDHSEFFINSDFSMEQIPYHFSGVVSDNIIHVSGDYNSDLEINLGETISGKLILDGFPIPIMGTSFITSIDSDFRYSGENGAEVNVVRFEVEEAGNKIVSNPKISLSGTGSRKGIYITDINFSDRFSAMDGNADIVWTKSDTVFTSLGLSLNLGNSITHEKLDFNFNLNNPDEKTVNIENIKKDFYIDSAIDIKNFNLNRFTKVKADNNLLSANVSVTGTFEHPYVGLNLENARIIAAGDFFTLKGTAFLEDRNLILNDFNAYYRGINIKEIRSDFDLQTFTGNFFAEIDADFANKLIELPLKLNVSECVRTEGHLIPDTFNLELSSEGASGNLIRKKSPFSIGAVVAGKNITLVSSENVGLFGNISETGNLYCSWNCGQVINAQAKGTYDYDSGNLDVGVEKLLCDLGELFKIINIDSMLKINNGIVEGGINVSGTLDTPDFMGMVTVKNPDFQIPSIVQQHVTAPSFDLIFHDNEIELPETKFFVKKTNEVMISAKIIMNKWFLEHVDCKIKNQGNKTIPVKLVTPVVEIGGKANFDLDLWYEGEVFDISGFIGAEDAEIFTNLTKLTSQRANVTVSKPKSTYIQCNLDVLMGNHVRLNAEPLVRCVFVPNTSINVQFDEKTKDLGMDGQVNIKTGDIAYLNRSFYIKEGRFDFDNRSDQFNPLISVRAETRERDDEGDSVRIILTADKQYLTNLEPRFSSIPAKSENEISRILGQIVVADSDNVSQFIFAAGDYALSQTFGRKIENSLRDFLNFDIFSVRTNILQNTMNLGMSKDNGFDKITAGNFLDNSTVYMGKYFGSELYLDAMVHLEYDKDRTAMGGLLFQPELGMELDSPFGNIRWSMAPDINAMMESRFVPSTALSLSWKFSF